MSTQANKKSAIDAESVSLAAMKKATDIPVISADSDQRVGYWRDQVEDFITELTKLRCLSGLLNGQNENNTINLSELCWLIDPSIEKLKDIADEMSEIFCKKQVAFLELSQEQAKLKQQGGDHDHGND